MATKGKESAQVKVKEKEKEKRGISPTTNIHADTTQRRTSPNPSTTGSIDHKHGATQSEKRVPNYLKPTISSSHDPSMHTKKQTSNTAQKPLLNRRRSLEKPPSSSQLYKTRTSPSPGERNVRSSSAVLPKTTTSPKTHTERLPKAPRNIGKSNSFSARPGSVKKCTRTTIKKLNNESTSVATPKPPSSISSDGPNTPTFESEQEDLESWASEVEKEIVIKVESNNIEEISILEENEDVDMVQAELENEEEEQLIKLCESSNILQDQNASVSAEMKDPVDKVYVEETNDDHHEGEQVHGTEESDKNHPEESFAGEPKLESEQKEGEEVTTEKSQGKAPDENEEVDDGSRTLNSKEREEEEEGVAKEAKPEAENVMAKSQGGQGKKDSPASNDVIEETASKLLEMRKNKVKALVGAFETVMNLQEPEA